MKKILSLIVMVLLSVELSMADGPNFSDRTRQIVAQVGVPFSFCPASDLGMSASIPDKSSDYSASNSAFYISYVIAGTDENPNSCCQLFTLVPKYTGNFTFSQTLYWKRWTDYGTFITSSATMTYYITVIDVKSISMVNTLSLYVGDKETLTPVITDLGAQTTLTWNSSNSSVATVSPEGTVTAISEGKTTITCTAHNGVSASCQVTVNPVLVSDITLNETEAELTIGERLQMETAIAPDNATYKSVTWSSTNETVAIVNEDGLVTAVGSGSCQIKAMANDGSGTTASCLITVPGNVLYCEDFGAVPGATITLPIQLKNTDAIQGFEFKLVLPEGVSVKTNDAGKPTATLSNRATEQGLGCADKGNGVYQFVYTSMDGLSGNSGPVVNVPLVVANDMAVGQYDVLIKDVELVKTNSLAIHHNDRTAILNIEEMILGDVTGDGQVSVADAISIINFVLGRMPASFIEKAADVNGDKSTSLADAVATVDKILADSGKSARATKPTIMLDPQ